MSASFSSAGSLSPLELAIVKQIDFYFGRQNFPHDHYLLGLCDQAGWVALAHVLGFPRMSQMGAANLPCIAALLAVHSATVQVDSNGHFVRPAWLPMPLVTAQALTPSFQQQVPIVSVGYRHVTLPVPPMPHSTVGAHEFGIYLGNARERVLRERQVHCNPRLQSGDSSREARVMTDLVPIKESDFDATATSLTSKSQGRLSPPTENARSSVPNGLGKECTSEEMDPMCFKFGTLNVSWDLSTITSESEDSEHITESVDDV